MGEHSFYKTNKNLVDGSDVKEAWDTFMLQQLEKDREGGVDIVGGDRVRPGVRALLILQRNNYGEPILLHPGTLPFEYTSFKPFLVDMIRAMFTMLYGTFRISPSNQISSGILSIPYRSSYGCNR